MNLYSVIYRATLLITLYFLGTQVVYAQASENVFRMSVFALTRTDPPGASNAILAHILAKQGYSVEFVLTPPKRMQYSLKNGTIDGMQASGLARSTRNLKEKDPFIQASYPMVSFPVSIYYKQSNEWRPSWPAQDDFINQPRGVTINYHYLIDRGFDLTQIFSPEAGAKMVNFDRADYWIEVMTVTPGAGSIRKTIDDGYNTKKLFDSPLFLLFNDNDEGREFKRMWDEGFRALMQNPDDFAEVYLQGLPKAYFIGPLNDYLDYIFANYPEFSRPKNSQYIRSTDPT